jgi:hypothetical protein
MAETKQQATPEQYATALKNARAAEARLLAAQNSTSSGSSAGTSSSAGAGSSGGKREIECPFCKGEILPKHHGRTHFAITSLLPRFPKIRIPIMEILNFLLSLTPVPKDAIRKKPESCEACKGKKTIEDPSDDSAKWQQVKANALGQAESITQEENKLAPGCGNRHTLIQGSEVHEVGLCFNDAQAYRVDEQKSIRAWGLLDPSDVNVEKGGVIPKGSSCNHVQGINSMASPGGHFLMKCANKYSLVAGAQGIEMTTGGPLTINAGVVRFTGPELTIGTKTGRLVLEGEVINLNGKSVEVAPTDGHMYVSGTISNKGNYHCGGHTHSESISFCKGETSGRNEPSKPSAQSDLYTGNAWYGGLAFEAISSSLRDVGHFILNRVSNPIEAQQLPSIRFFFDLNDKVLQIGYNLRPIELHWTGLCYVMYGSSGGIHPVFNFPHQHALPNMSHNHETRIPDIDCTAETAAQVRGKQGGVSGPAPLAKKTGAGEMLKETLFAAINTVVIPSSLALQKSVAGGPNEPT